MTPLSKVRAQWPGFTPWWIAIGSAAGLLNGAGFLVSVFFANAWSAWLAADIAREHGRGQAMRRAWMLIALGMLCNAARIAYELGFHFAGHTDSSLSPLLGLRQFPIVASLVAMSVGLHAMWSSFRSLGLGVRLHKLDWALMAAIILLIPPVVWSRSGLNDARSPFAIVRYLQVASPALLAIPASMAVVLYRISRELGEGFMALALRWMAAALGIRLVALVVATAITESNTAGNPLVIFAHWAFLAALLCRRRLSLVTSDLVEQYSMSGPALLATLGWKKIQG